MKRQLLSSVAGAALLLGVAPAQAQTPYNWTGFYVGLNAGGVRGSSNATTRSDCAGATPGFSLFCEPGAGAGNAAVVDAAGTGSMHGGSLTGGIQFGFNWQNANLVYGWEADFGAFGVRISRQGRGVFPEGNGPVAPGDTFIMGTSVEADWLATFRGRLAMALSPQSLLYLTGGPALTRLKTTNRLDGTLAFGGTPITASGSSSRSELRWGFAVGAGFEWAIAPHWTARAEYLYVDFGNVSTNMVASGPIPGFVYSQNISTRTDLTADVVRAGINYKF